MSVRRWLGIDGFDAAVHVVVTVCAILILGPGMGGDPAFVLGAVPAASLLLLSWRRRRGLSERASEPSGEAAAYQVYELEQRIAELEAAQQRVLELEERLDFAERLLTRSPEAQRQEQLP